MCRRNNYNNTYIASTPQYQCGRRGRRQYQQALIPIIAATSHQTSPSEVSYYRAPACKRERRGRCCGKRSHAHNNPIYAVSTSSHPFAQNPTRDLGFQQEKQVVLLPQTNTYDRRRGGGPISGMASLLIAGIAGIGYGAHKLHEKRKEKKAAKLAALGEVRYNPDVESHSEGEDEIDNRDVHPALRNLDARRTEGVDGRRSKSEEAREGRENIGEAPPSYDAAVALPAGTSVQEQRV